MRSAKFERGEVLLREDEPPRAFHMLVAGKVTMRRHGRKIRTIGAPGGVGFLSLLARTRGGPEAVAEEYAADEIMIVTLTHEHQARRRSYELLAQAFGLVADRSAMAVHSA